MGKQQPRLLKWLTRPVALLAACGFTIDAGSAPGYLAWVQPPPLRFASPRVPKPLPLELQEARPVLPVESGGISATNPITGTLPPDSNPDPGSAPNAEEQPATPTPPPEEMVTGPEAMFSEPVPATRPLILVTPQSLVELMRMHGTNAAFAPPSISEPPVFIPPVPPASRATYHSAPASKP